MNSQDRAHAAGVAIEAHCDATNDHDNDSYTDVVDLLTNLRHYCKANQLSFGQAVQSSWIHYQAEK